MGFFSLSKRGVYVLMSFSSLYVYLSLASFLLLHLCAPPFHLFISPSFCLPCGSLLQPALPSPHPFLFIPSRPPTLSPFLPSSHFRSILPSPLPSLSLFLCSSFFLTLSLIFVPPSLLLTPYPFPLFPSLLLPFPCTSLLPLSSTPSPTTASLLPSP